MSSCSRGCKFNRQLIIRNLLQRPQITLRQKEMNIVFSKIFSWELCSVSDSVIIHPEPLNDDFNSMHDRSAYSNGSVSERQRVDWAPGRTNVRCV